MDTTPGTTSSYKNIIRSDKKSISALPLALQIVEIFVLFRAQKWDKNSRWQQDDSLSRG